MRERYKDERKIQRSCACVCFLSCKWGCEAVIYVCEPMQFVFSVLSGVKKGKCTVGCDDYVVLLTLCAYYETLKTNGVRCGQARLVQVRKSKSR